MEDYLIDQHFAGKPIKCNDEQAAKMATEAFYDTPKSIIKEWSNLDKIESTAFFKIGVL